ncbi:MAG: AtpZ/AtpI family protein [Alphaproteobacteria bacterium]|nr:AtpZ/AtpI family protein [Alphaproteobacteria bacterium]
MRSEKQKLDDLSARIRQAQAKKEPKTEKPLSPVRNAGYDFAGILFGSVLMGVLLDRFLDTSPWSLVSAVGLGFVTGVLGLWRSMQKSRDGK